MPRSSGGVCCSNTCRSWPTRCPSTPEGATFDRWVAGGIYQLVGVTALEWLADADIWDNLIHEEDRAAVLDGWEALKRDQAPFDRQYRLRRHDGGIVWVHDRAVITERDGARVVEGALADITARHDAEAALGIAEERFRTLVEQLPAITFIEEIETGANLYVSPQIEAVYGYTAEEWMADSTLWEQRLHPEDRDRVMASNDAETGDEWSIDYRSLAQGRQRRVDPQRRAADPRPRRYPAVLAGRGLRHHRAHAGRGAAPDGGGALPHPRRAAPRRRLHRRRRRSQHRALHQPAVRATHRLHPRAAPARSGSLGEDAAPRGSGPRARPLGGDERDR